MVYHFGGEEALALVHGDPTGREAVLARVHSECLTGEVFGSQRCDCRAQLEYALERIAGDEAGVLVYLRQEGRGIGLGNKVRAYALQDEGRDTVEANLALGFAPDLRSYEIAASILRDLGVVSVRLMTNNPDKIAGLRNAGVLVEEQVPHWVESSQLSHEYLEVKRSKLGHVGASQPLGGANAAAAGVAQAAPTNATNPSSTGPLNQTSRTSIGKTSGQRTKTRR